MRHQEAVTVGGEASYLTVILAVDSCILLSLVGEPREKLIDRETERYA